MEQAFGSAADFDEHAKGLHAANDAFVHLVYLRNEANSAHDFFGALHAHGVDAADFYAAHVAHLFDGDGGSGFSLNALNNLTAGSDYAANEVLGNLEAHHFRSVRLELNARSRHGLEHFAKDVGAAFAGLVQGLLHDFEAEALNLDVHLARGDAVGRTGYLEVHIAEVVFVTKDVAQHGELAGLGVGDQAHSDTAYWARDRNTGVHQGEGSGTHCGHGARTVGFQDVRYDANRVGVLGGDHFLEGALCEVAVADFAAAGSAQHARFTRRERGKVVVQVEALVAHKGGGVDAVAVQRRTQGNRGKRLGFAAREQGATVGARKHVSFAPNGANFGGRAAVKALSVLQDLVAHGVVLYLVVVHLGQRAPLGQLFFGHRRRERGVDGLECLAALGFVGQFATGNLKRTRVGGVPHALLELFVVGFVVVGALGGGANFGGQLELGSNLNLDGFVGYANRFEHFGLRNLVHFAFNHHDAVF